VDVLWSPWRYDYIKSGSETHADNPGGCIFCDILNNPASDEEKFILKRAGFNLIEKKKKHPNHQKKFKKKKPRF
jgi:hypothetical protein